MARAQKCGGVQRKITPKRTTGAQVSPLVTADQPISTGAAPAAPPMTMLRLDVRLSHSVETKTEKRQAATASTADSRLTVAHRNANAATSIVTANVSPARGEMRPLAMGRLQVLGITLSLSRSTSLLRVLAPPA